MAQLRIQGGNPLQGEVTVQGRKNSAVAVIPAALLAHTPSELGNLPQISDVRTYARLLGQLGADVELDGKTLYIDPRPVNSITADAELTRQMRASYYLMGVLLGRYGEAHVPLPGGCDIGQRGIDLHLKGFEALGAEVESQHGIVHLRASKLQGANIYLDISSVGATINIMMAAVLAEGTTVVENAAKESHIVDLATYLNTMGAHVVGAGTDVIKIYGVDRLEGTSHAVIPDEIVAATYMMAGAATGGDILVRDVISKHIEPVTAKLREAGASIEISGGHVRVCGPKRLQAVNVKTMPYPGFPTDAQQPMTVVLALAKGTSMLTETIYQQRFKHIDELQRMGCQVKVEGHTAIIEGVESLYGASVTASDLRAGAALVIAGGVAEGSTVIDGVEHIDRGYQRIEETFRSLGMDIVRVPDEAAAIDQSRRSAAGRG